MYKTAQIANRRQRTDDLSQQQTSVFSNFVQPEHALLEYGCGAASILCALPGRHKAGVEVNTERASVATSQGIDVRPNISSFAGKTFDRIIVSQALQKLVAPEQELRRLGELLADSGQLIISQPIDTGSRLVRPSEFRTQIQTLRTLLTEAGLTPETISVNRYLYRSSPFHFGKGPSQSPHFATRKTYSMVKPFLSLVAVATAR